MPISPRRQIRQLRRALRPLVAPGQQLQPHPRRRRQRRPAPRWCWRARISVGRHHHALPARLDRDQQRQKRHQRLARPDIALQQPVHPQGLRHVGGNLGDGAGLRAGRRIGQAFQHPRLQHARAAAFHPLAPAQRAPAPATASTDARTARHRPAAAAPDAVKARSACVCGAHAPPAPPRANPASLRAPSGCASIHSGKIRRARQRRLRRLCHQLSA